MAEELTIALAGNPNCGKTTLFNELTGSNGYVGNWPGVTVEKKMAAWKKNKQVTFVDLPGVYSLSPYSPEEVVTRDFLVDSRPDAIINLIDVTNLERNLYLSTQILECGLPTVVGLNMCDLLKERGDVINTEELSKKLGCPVVEVSALRNKNLDKLVEDAICAAKERKVAGAADCFAKELKESLDKISALLPEGVNEQLKMWYSVKAFERDEAALGELELSGTDFFEKAEAITAALEEAEDDDSESLITSARYEWISTVMDACVKQAPKKLTTSQKIDRVVTNRVLGLPIFAAAMILVYYIAISTVGTAWTDWVNDNLFSDGFFISGQAEYDAAAEAYAEGHYQDKIDGYLAAADEAGIDTTVVTEALSGEADDAERESALESFETEAEAKDVVAKDVAVHDSDGNFVTTDGEVVTRLDADGNPVVDEGKSLEVLDSVSLADFIQATEVEEPDPHDFGTFIDSIPTAVTNALTQAGASDFVISLVVDGIVGGVGSVLGFIPQIFVLFVMLCFLEDCGYMSRVAFVMDRVFRRFGLSGKSFIPMLISSGCGVPGVLSTRTIENERDRRMTAMLTTMIPCSAKLPIIALVMGVIAGGSDMWWVAPMFYFLGIVAIIVSAVMLKKSKPFAGDPVPFVMELPDYHMPSLRSWFLHVWERVSAYAKKAGTIIFAAAVGIWFLSNFGFATWEGGSAQFSFLPEAAGAPENFMDYSLLAAFGGVLAPLFAPLGFGNWMASASSVSALIAKENLVSTFGVLYGLGDATENSVSMWQGFAGMFTDAGGFHMGAMCAFVGFNMLCAPCFAAMGAIRKQMGSAAWTAFAIIYECVFGWVIALFINQFYELAVYGNFGFWTAVAFVLLALMLFQIFRPAPKFKEKEAKANA